MAVDYILHYPCEPKKTLGEGDILKGTEQILEALKARNRAEAIAEMARRDGQSPQGKAVTLRLAMADGTVKDTRVTYFDSAPLTLRWDTRTNEGCEETEGMEFTAAPFEMGTARSFIASLCPGKDRADTFEIVLPTVRVKRQGADQRIGAVADLAERDQRVFPPAAAESGGPGTGG